MRSKRLAFEALTIVALIIRGVQMVDEVKRLYTVHKPKGYLGFVRPERKRWFSRRPR
jgi:hypothetical protein